VGGSAKTIGALQWLRHQNLYSRDLLPQAEERIWLSSTLVSKVFLLEFTQEASAYWQSGSTAAVTLPDFSPVNAWNAQWNLWDEPSTQGVYRIARAYAQVTLGDLELRVGKQVIPTGVGKMFAAVNQVPRLPFTMVDQEYQRGEDAVSAKWGHGLVLEARLLPKVANQKNHNFHLRTKTQRTGYDLGITAGRSDDKIYIGVELAGNLGEDLVRSELVGFNYEGRDVVQALIGFDHVFGPKWSLTAEAFYNGFGSLYEDYRIESYPHRSSPYRGKYYGGVVVTWETTDRLKTSLTGIVNLQDPSTLMHLLLNYSLGNNVDVIVGQYLNLSGRPRGEFGGKLNLPVLLPVAFEIGLPDITYGALRWYF